MHPNLPESFAFRPACCIRIFLPISPQPLEQYNAGFQTPYIPAPVQYVFNQSSTRRSNDPIFIRNANINTEEKKEKKRRYPYTKAVMAFSPVPRDDTEIIIIEKLPEISPTTYPLSSCCTKMILLLVPSQVLRS